MLAEFTISRKLITGLKWQEFVYTSSQTKGYILVTVKKIWIRSYDRNQYANRARVNTSD